MSAVSYLNERYDQYAEKVAALWKETNPLSRAFDIGSTPKNHPCHMEYYEELSRWVNDFINSDPVYPELLSVTHWFLKAEAAKEGPANEPAWILFAVQGLAKPLIPMLNPEDRDELRTAYDNLYPRRRRLPVQKEVYRLLKK